MGTGQPTEKLQGLYRYIIKETVDELLYKKDVTTTYTVYNEKYILDDSDDDYTYWRLPGDIAEFLSNPNLGMLE